MREYKFRGKCIDTSEWVYGNLIVQGEKPYIVSEIEIICDGECADLCATEWREVHPESVGQCTGINDVNGKEVYEGDIIKTYEVYNNRVDENILVCKSEDGLQDLSFWKENEWGVPLCYISEGYENKGVSYPMVECKTIGNIHDNPELIGRI